MDFTPGTETFRDLMSNGRRYLVPRFQRDYAWTQDQWLDLWEDLVATAQEGAEQHYMGYLVLQRADDRTHLSIIDGQQRIATLSLVVIAAMYELQALAAAAGDADSPDQKRVEVFRNGYLAGRGAVDLRPFHKLSLNRNNETYFRTLARLGRPPVRGVKATVRLLGAACEFFRGKIRERAHGGEAIASLIEGMASGMFFTTLSVSSDLDAYRVFETLNARGVQLSTPDLVKNYLFSLIDTDGLHIVELDELDQRWARISDQLGGLRFTDFVLTEWNRRNPPQAKRTLFRAIRFAVQTADQASAYLEKLEEASEIFAALDHPEDAFWKQDDARAERRLRQQLRGLKLFQIKQPRGLLMTIWQTGDRNAFQRALGWVYAFSMRYQVIGGRPHQPLIAAYHDASIAYSEGGRVTLVREVLTRLLPGAEEFERDFLEHSIPTIQSERKARFLLARLEEEANGQEPVDDETLTLEHILPRNPDGEWFAAFGDHADDDIDRIGNLALLPGSINRSLGRADFDAKREALNRSGLRTNELDASGWNHQEVMARQQSLAALASRAWQIHPA